MAEIEIYVGGDARRAQPAGVDRLYARLDEPLDVRRLPAECRDLARHRARSADQILHHGDFIVTSDPALIIERVRAHDCPSCRRNAAAMLSILAENPDARVLIGELYWTGTRPSLQ